MSGFAVVFERSSTPVQPGVLERIMEKLSHRGPDGRCVYRLNYLEMGHWHFWTTPEEIGEHQPLSINRLPFTIVLDGRVDNRADIIRELRLTFDNSSLSDAALILFAYDRWGENCFEHLVGEFALVIFDQHRGELICARDALGVRTLFYAINRDCLVIASEAWALITAQESHPSLDDDVIAHFFSFRAIPDGRTLFKGISEVLPAEVVVFASNGERRRKYWYPDFSHKVRGRSAQEYAEEFCSLLAQAVQCRMRSVTPAGVLMSGGLDSTSVACFASLSLAPQPLTTISYVFDRFPACDEREYISEMQRQWGVNSIQVTCDEANPFNQSVKWIQNPSYPLENPFRIIREKGYRCAQSEGIRVLLTGGFGDHLYGRGSDWLADMWSDGRVLQGIRDTIAHMRAYPLKEVWDLGFLQSAARRMINALPGGRNIHRKPSAPEWLTPYAADCVIQTAQHASDLDGRDLGLVSLRSAMSASYEDAISSYFSVEFRHPYRDLRLIEYVLTIPAYQLYYRGSHKFILRNAMKGVLPDKIRARYKPTYLKSFISSGIEREAGWITLWLESEDCAWGKYVNREWLMNNSRNIHTSTKRDYFALILWICYSYEIWYKNYFLKSRSI